MGDLRDDGESGRPTSVNIADLAIDRYVRRGHGDRVALRSIGRDRDDLDQLQPGLADLDRNVDFWLELQVDSMDHLAVMTGLSEQTGIDIAEHDYLRLTTVNTLRDFLASGGR